MEADVFSCAPAFLQFLLGSLGLREENHPGEEEGFVLHVLGNSLCTLGLRNLGGQTLSVTLSMLSPKMRGLK